MARARRPGAGTAVLAWLWAAAVTVAVGSVPSVGGQDLGHHDDALPQPGSALIPADEETTRAALLLLDDAVTVQIDGGHHALLRALRHLGDPKLGPLFTGLSAPHRHPSLRIHGLLGSAELTPSESLGVNEIAQIRRRDLQAELIGAALDGGLLDHQAIDTLLGWPGLDPAVKVLLAAPRVGGQAFDAQSAGYPAVVSALNSSVPGQRGLAALLLHELGDPHGTEVLDKFTQQAGSTAEAVTAMLLEAAWTHELRRVGSWALAVAQHEGTSERVELLALKVAVRYGRAGAEQAWADRVERAIEADDLPRQTRLALIGLEIAPWLDAARFAPLSDSADPLIAKLGDAGREVAVYRQDDATADAVEAAIGSLLESAHPQVWRWAAEYTKETGSAVVGRTILQRYEPGEPRGRSRRLEAVAKATEVLLDAPQDDTAAYLAAALSDPEADPSWRHAVLLGLIRSGGELPLRIAARLPEFTDRDTAALVLVLRTQVDSPLSDNDQEFLEQIIQNHELDDSLRVQTAWVYLDRTGQGTAAIAALLAPGPASASAGPISEP